jgi:hypothetical protein
MGQAANQASKQASKQAASTIFNYIEQKTMPKTTYFALVTPDLAQPIHGTPSDPTCSRDVCNTSCWTTPVQDLDI